jgi:transposase InsO family protein
MGRRGNPYDNAKAESFMKTLKVEEVYLMAYETFAADLRPHEGKIGSSGPFQRCASGPSAAVPGKTPTSLNASERRPCCSEVP